MPCVRALHGLGPHAKSGLHRPHLPADSIVSRIDGKRYDAGHTISDPPRSILGSGAAFGRFLFCLFSGISVEPRAQIRLLGLKFVRLFDFSFAAVEGQERDDPLGLVPERRGPPFNRSRFFPCIRFTNRVQVEASTRGELMGRANV